MKKMMIVMAVSLMAMMGQAATVTWGASALKTADSSGNFTTTALSGAIAYLFDASSVSLATTTAAIANKTFDGTGSLYNKLTSTAGTIAQAGIGNYSNTDVTLYMVVFNAATVGASDWYMVSSEYKQTFTTANKTYNFTSAGKMPSAWTAIPEPTSMALLGLGVALLALRRKHC